MKKRLAELEGPDGEPFYAPRKPEYLDDGTKRGRSFRNAVREFQETLDNPYERPDAHKSKNPRSRKWPDGLVAEGGYTWRHLFPTEKAEDSDEESPPGEKGPPATRTVFSLLMHVGALGIEDALDRKKGSRKIRWPARVMLKPTKEDEAAEAARKKEEDARDGADQAEALEHRLEGDVGPKGGSPRDVVWVRKRLITLGFLDPLPEGGEPIATVDDALLAAIEAFEARHVFKREANKSKADGHIRRGKLTEKQLHKTRRQLESKHREGGKRAHVPEVFLDRLERIGADGMAMVVGGLDVPVKAGEPLWVAGKAAAFDDSQSIALKGQVHWEMFSAGKIFKHWDAIIDTNDDDLITDAPQKLMDEVENPKFEHWPFKRDGLISPGELFHYYSTAKSHALRTTQVKFTSEWGLDLDKTLDRLAELGWRTDGLRERLEPYQWWSLAGGTVPGDPSVWHYNPIQFVLEYQRVLGAFAPPKLKDSEKFVPLQIIVLNKHGGTQPKVTVRVLGMTDVAYDASEITNKRTWRGKGGGEAFFINVPVGHCDIYVEGSLATTLVLKPKSYPVHRVWTTLDGDPPPVGKLQVNVRKATGTVARNPDVTVVVRDVYGNQVGRETTSWGKAIFPETEFGPYQVSLDDADAKPAKVTVQRKGWTRTTLRILPAFGELYVGVVHGDIVVDDVDVVVTQGTADTTVVAQTKDGTAAHFTLRAGLYKVFARDPSTGERLSKPKPWRVVAGKTKQGVVKIKVLPTDPELEMGTTARIEVFVSDGGAAVEDEPVTLLDDAGEFLSQVATDDDGVVPFDIPPGAYAVIVDDQRAESSVAAGETHNMKFVLAQDAASG